jgi:hypothetical protein
MLGDESSHRYYLDEEARQTALNLAAGTMHFVRRQTLQWSHTDFADSVFQQQSVTYHGHLGKSPIVIDMMAQRYFEQMVARNPPNPELLGKIVLLGEEASLTDWDPNYPGRVTIFRCDPIDGTSSLAHLGDGFTTVVTVESRGDAGRPWKHYGGAIVRSDGSTVSWSRRSVLAHHVAIDLSTDLELGESPATLDLDALPQLATRDVDEVFRKNHAKSGAAVAAQSQKRRDSLLGRFQRLILEAEFFDFRAGTAACWPLCTGLLGWVVEINPTTIHDSVHLYPFSALGGRVVDLDFAPLDVLRLIEGNAGPESLEKVFPPYIAYVDADSLEFIRGHTDGAQ